MVLQVNGHKTYNYKASDAALLNVVSKIIAGTADSILIQKRSLVAVQRSFDILDIFKTLLSERNHAMLFYHIMRMFPRLFSFKDSGVLFSDIKSKHLYFIHSDDYERTAIDLNEDNIVRYPNNIGLTGLAVDSKEIVVTREGAKDRNFSPEVDNFVNLNKISNMMIGAMVDKNGEVKGVLQLMNKNSADGEITEQDKNELAALLPALGEIIRTADESMEVSRLSYSKKVIRLRFLALKTILQNINNAVFDKNKVRTL